MYSLCVHCTKDATVDESHCMGYGVVLRGSRMMCGKQAPTYMPTYLLTYTGTLCWMYGWMDGLLTRRLFTR